MVQGAIIYMIVPSLHVCSTTFYAYNVV